MSENGTNQHRTDTIGNQPDREIESEKLNSENESPADYPCPDGYHWDNVTETCVPDSDQP